MGRLRELVVLSVAVAMLGAAVPASAVDSIVEPTAGAAANTLAPTTSSTAGSAVTTPTPAPLPHRRLQDDELKLRFAGKWESRWTRLASGQTYRRSKTRGAYARASIEGTGVALVARRGPDRGRARIYIDGVSRGTVDLYAPTYRSTRVVWRSAPLPHRDHSIKIVVLGTKRAASRAAWVNVDAIDVVGRVNPMPLSGALVNSGSAKLVKRGSWVVSKRDEAFGDSAWRTSAKGATVTVRFKGTSVAWIGRKDAFSGKAAVILDGRRVGTVSQYRSKKSERRVIWAKSGLSYGTHNLTIRSLHAASTGSGVRTDVDAFLVGGTPVKAYPPTPFKYPWPTYIVVDKSDFKLYWVNKGVLIKKYPIAHGKASTPTPSRVWRIDQKYHTDPSSVYGPRKMRMYKRVKTSSGYRYEFTRYGTHGTNEPWVIGTRASHGCIRMYNKDVLELYPQVPLHTMMVTRD